MKNILIYEMDGVLDNDENAGYTRGTPMKKTCENLLSMRVLRTPHKFKVSAPLRSVLNKCHCT